jgi:hypothetical protein
MVKPFILMLSLIVVLVYNFLSSYQISLLGLRTDVQDSSTVLRTRITYLHILHTFSFFFFVRLLALRPLLAYCASLGWYVKMIVEKQMECRLAGETEVLGENLPQLHFCPSQNPTWPDPNLNPGRRGGKPATNRLSYGAALPLLLQLLGLPVLLPLSLLLTL